MPKNVQEKNSKGLNYSQLWIKRKNSKVLSFPLLVKNKPLLKIYNTPKSMESVLLTVVGTEFKKQESSDSNMKGSFIKYFRKLPFVTAGNPVNYGKPYQLSCAEALATALCSIGYNDQAQFIMSKFGWADGFWSLNPFIDNYSKCKTLE